MSFHPCGADFQEATRIHKTTLLASDTGLHAHRALTRRRLAGKVQRPRALERTSEQSSGYQSCLIMSRAAEVLAGHSGGSNWQRRWQRRHVVKSTVENLDKLAGAERMRNRALRASVL
jgi:hypothetical protein